MTENGLTPKMFNGIGKAITSLEGDNLAARVERWKSISGLNYKGAYELDRMYQKGGMSESEIASTIDSMRKDNDYKSEETKKMDMINSIDINVQKIGQSKFWDNLDKLEAMQSEYTGLPTTKTKEEKVKQNLTILQKLKTNHCSSLFAHCSLFYIITKIRL